MAGAVVALVGAMAPIVAPARALLLGLVLLLASGCAAPGDEAVAGESATRRPESAAAAADRRVGSTRAAGSPADDAGMAALGATGVAERPAGVPASAAATDRQPPDGAPAAGRVDDAASGPARRVGDPAVLGDLVVTVVEARRTERGARATFTIENRGPAPAVVSPGNFRLRTDGARPRMRLSGTPAPLPVGTLKSGDSLQGEVTWELPEGAALGVVFVTGAASADWQLPG